MLDKIKVIHLAHASHSYFANENDDLKKIILNDWYSKVSKQLKKSYPKIDVECWAPEKINKVEEKFVEEGILFRFFPVTFSPLYALDFSIPMLKKLKKEIKESKNQGYKLIIHLHEYHNLHGLIIASIFKKQKIIAQHHGGSWPLKHLKESKEKRKFFPFFILGQIWENAVLKNIDCFYALSKSELEYLKKIAPKSKIKFQTMGIDKEYFKKQSKTKARKKLKLKQREKIILYIGRINKTKGIKYLINAMTRLQGVELKIIGFGQEVDFFKRYAKENGLNNIKFLGGVFGKKKLLYLSAADALVLPSSKEGAPVTIMEALARNLPVVTTGVGGIPLMIKNGREGIIIKQKNSQDVVKGINEISKWKNKNIRKHAGRYKWEKIINNTVRDYKEI